MGIFNLGFAASFWCLTSPIIPEVIFLIHNMGPFNKYLCWYSGSDRLYKPKLKVFFFSPLPLRVMRVYSTHTKKKAFCVSKMTSGPLADGEVCRNFGFNFLALNHLNFVSKFVLFYCKKW